MKIRFLWKTRETQIIWQLRHVDDCCREARQQPQTGVVPQYGRLQHPHHCNRANVSLVGRFRVSAIRCYSFWKYHSRVWSMVRSRKIILDPNLFSLQIYTPSTNIFCFRFNYRSTAYMVQHGFYNFLNWFDERAWYPLGRIVGGTVYPGLMLTSGTIHWILHAINIPIHIRDICVFLAPVFRYDICFYKIFKQQFQQL